MVSFFQKNNNDQFKIDGKLFRIKHTESGNYIQFLGSLKEGPMKVVAVIGDEGKFGFYVARHTNSNGKAVNVIEELCVAIEDHSKSYKEGHWVGHTSRYCFENINQQNYIINFMVEALQYYTGDFDEGSNRKRKVEIGFHVNDNIQSGKYICMDK